MLLREYLEQAYIHCVHYLVNKTLHWMEKIFWFICIILSMLCCYYVINLTIFDFENQKVSMMMDTSYLNWETKFPSIVFCEKTNKKGTRVMYHLHPELKLSSKRSAVEENINYITFFRGSFTKNTDEWPVKNNFSYYAELARSECNEIFSSCLYNNVEFNCCKQFLPFHSYFGYCFAMNNLATKDSKGNFGRISFYIKPGPNEGLGNLSIELTSPNFVILALSQESMPSVKNIEESVLLASDNRDVNTLSTYNVFLRTRNTKTTESALLLDISQRSCRIQKENHLKRIEVYSYSGCILECLIETQLRHCGCTMHLFPNILPEEECNTTGWDCISGTKEEVIQDDVKKCYCEIGCDEAVVMKVGATEEETLNFRNENSTVRFNFLVPTPPVRFYRNAVKTRTDFVVAVGGIMGLFLGVTALTFVQIFVYIFIRPFTNFYRSIRKIRREQKRKHINKNFWEKRQELIMMRNCMKKIRENNENLYLVKSYNFQASPPKK